MKSYMADGWKEILDGRPSLEMYTTIILLHFA
jgi:hypothetical protein